ncbi:MAG: hypothetical protein V3S11_03210, partial [Elusimicrobiota bacterium]
IQLRKVGRILDPSHARHKDYTVFLVGDALDPADVLNSALEVLQELFKSRFPLAEHKVVDALFSKRRFRLNRGMPSAPNDGDSLVCRPNPARERQGRMILISGERAQSHAQYVVKVCENSVQIEAGVSFVIDLDIVFRKIPLQIEQRERQPADHEGCVVGAFAKGWEN